MRENGRYDWKDARHGPRGRRRARAGHHRRRGRLSDRRLRLASGRAARSARAAPGGGGQRGHLGALPLLFPLRGLAASPRLRCDRLRLSRHRRIAPAGAGAVRGELARLGRARCRGGAALRLDGLSRPADRRGRAQHRRGRAGPGALEPSGAPRLHDGRAIRALARLRAAQPGIDAVEVAPGDAAGERALRLFPGTAARLDGGHAARWCSASRPCARRSWHSA